MIDNIDVEDDSHCKLCNHPFTVSSINLKLRVEHEGGIKKVRVCGQCYSAEMAKDE